MAGGPLGVLVGEPVAHREQHRWRGVVLAGDELQLVTLAVQLVSDRVRDVWLGGAHDFDRRPVGSSLM